MTGKKQSKADGPGIGEGNVEADRRYREATREFVEDGKVEGAARKAKDALEGPEGEELEQARRETGAREPGKPTKR